MTRAMGPRRAMSVMRLLALIAFALAGSGPARASAPCPMHDWLVWIYVEGETLARAGPGMFRLEEARSLSKAIASADPASLARVMRKAGLEDGLPVVSGYIELVADRLRFVPSPPEAGTVVRRMQGYLRELRCRADPAWRAGLELATAGGLAKALGSGGTSGARPREPTPHRTGKPPAPQPVIADTAGQDRIDLSPPETGPSDPYPPSRDRDVNTEERLRGQPDFSQEAVNDGQLGTRLPAMSKLLKAARAAPWLAYAAAGIGGLALAGATTVYVLRHMRRRTPRTLCHMNTYLRLPDGRTPAVAVDISPNGAKLHLKTVPEPGQRGTLELSGLEVGCRVTWSTTYFVGLAFLKTIDKAEFENLLQYHRWDASSSDMPDFKGSAAAAMDHAAKA
ncbi:PilZ domain-containing protein [Rhodovulum sulfidophilum]|nr:PilZ domain-containing protein [Rhodovulum sulfidophilum]